MSKEKSLYTTMMKIGLIGYGGGSALIPVMERELVNEKKLVSKKDFDKDVVVASITPGALPVEIATGAGIHVNRRAMILSALCMAAPGAILLTILLFFFSYLNDSVLGQIEYCALGISSFLLWVLTEYIIKEISQAKQEGWLRVVKVIVIIFSVFCLTGQKALFRLLGIEVTPLFSLSTVATIGLACFFICLTHGKYSLSRVFLPLLMISGYLFCVINNQISSLSMVRQILVVVMIVLMVYFCYQSFLQEEKKIEKFPWKRVASELGLWIAVIVISCLPTLLIFDDGLLFVVKGMISSFLSFGGGDAYLTLADSLFVENDLISSEDFYQILVPVANVLPGSILCKMLTGIGYLMGYQSNQNVLEAIIVAFSGLMIGVSCSGIVFTLIWELYTHFRQLAIFQSLKRFIRPIVAGLLINVMLSLVNQGIAKSLEFGLSSVSVILLIIVIYIINVSLARCFSQKNNILLFYSIVIALLFGNVCAFLLI